MVKGLELFKEHFKGHEDCFVLIGGTACDLAMDAAGETFRLTKDLDIVLCVEHLTPDFVRAFWEFVKAGRYDNRQKSTGRRLFYRFFEPAVGTYPYMLELFSRLPDSLKFKGMGRLTPIPMDGKASSLSAILLDDEYYKFLQDGKTVVDGLPVVRAEYLLPLKARAWLDLDRRKKEGEQIDSDDIRKHRNDVFKLFLILEPGNIPSLSGQVADDLGAFTHAMLDERLNLKSLGYSKGRKQDELIEVISKSYGISS